jgi:uncharacterized membrane protein
MRNLSKLALPGILITGFIIRLISLNQSLWLDEATTAMVSKMNLTEIFTKFLTADFHPPLYYLVLKYWTLIFGYSEVSLRIPSIIFGIVTVYVTYLIAKKLFNQRTALIASALLATSGLAIYYSQEARMYGMAAMLVAIAIYLFINKKWLYFSLSLVLIGMTDYVSLFIVPAFLIIGWKDFKKIALSFIPLLLSFILWSPIFIKQLSGGLAVAGSAWWNILGTATFKNIALIPVKFIFGRISFDDKNLYALLAGLAAFIFGYLLFRAGKAGREVWYWLITPILIGVLISFKVPTLSYFRFIFCLPAFYLLTAYGIEKAGKYKNAFLVAVIAINILSSGYYLFNSKFQREDWRAAATAIATDKIVFPANSQKEGLIYYGKGNQIVEVSALEPADRDIWLSRYVWEIVDPEDVTRQKIESLGYNMATEYNFNGVLLWKYTKNLYADRN